MGGYSGSMAFVQAVSKSWKYVDSGSFFLKESFVFVLFREPKKRKACFSKLEMPHPTLFFNYRCQCVDLINLQCSTCATDVVWDLTCILLWS